MRRAETTKIRVASLLLLLLGPLLAGCGPPSSTDTALRIERVENGLLTPIQFKGTEPERMMLSERMAHYQVPALSVAVLDGFEIAWARAYGVTRLRSASAVTPKVPFQVGSLSKPVTALVALRVVAAGELGLDDPVDAVLTSWKLPEAEDGGEEPVSVRHLLTGSAGFAPFSFPGRSRAGDIPTMLQLLQNEGPEYTPQVARVARPGQRLDLSANPAYGVLQQLLTDATGRSLDELARNEVFGPLGMESSAFEPNLPATQFDQAAWGHGRDGEPIEGKELVFPAAPGGLWTTPTDLCRFLAGLFRAWRGEPRAVLPQELATLMLTPQLEDAGFGVYLAGEGHARRLLHSGGTSGFRAFMVAFPSTGQGAVVMINNARGSRLIHEVLRAIAVEYGWPDYVPQREVIPMSAEAFERFEGQYQFAVPAGLMMTIRQEDGKFYRGRFEMHPVSETLFVVPEAGDELEFVTDAQGQATAFLYGQPGRRKLRALREPR